MPYTPIRPHTHVQSTPASTWTITHNSGYKPTISVLVMDNGQLTPILPMNVEHTSDNVVVITFSSNRTGEARLL